MPTDNRRVAAYLPKNIDDRLEAFKAERGFKGDSPALIAILSEFFEVSQEVAYQGDSNIRLQQQIEQARGELLSELQGRLFEFQTAIEQRLQTLEERVSLAQPEKVDLELPSEPEEELLDQQEVPGQLKLIPIEEEEISTTQTDELLNELDGELSVGKQTLTTGELAKRFGIDASTVSHWRPTGKRPKTPEALLKVTREKDPDGIGWIYLPDSKHFQSEKEIPSKLPVDSKSELLDAHEPEF